MKADYFHIKMFPLPATCVLLCVTELFNDIPWLHNATSVPDKVSLHHSRCSEPLIILNSLMGPIFKKLKRLQILVTNRNKIIKLGKTPSILPFSSKIVDRYLAKNAKDLEFTSGNSDIRHIAIAY